MPASSQLLRSDSQSCQCYDVVDPGAFFFVPAFRHPTVFFTTRHPLLFLAWGFFALGCLYVEVLEAVAKEAVVPEKNTRPVISAMITRNVLGMIVPFRELVSRRRQPFGGVYNVTVLLDPFYDTLVGK
jgi:hypothetical protein